MKKARIIEEHRTNYIIAEEDNEFVATVRGSFFYEKNFPKVGDYILFTAASLGKAVIEEVLPRTSTVVRKEVETGASQIIVANVDIIFIVVGLDGDFNLNRLERYLLLAKQSDIKAVVLLNKCDGVDDAAEYIEQVGTVATGIPVLAISALTGQGMEALLAHFTATTTAVLLGSSGAGKSTITNRLLNQAKQKVRGVRIDDSRGRHTTTSRQLFALPTGGFIIDTPGMRELSVLDSTTKDENVVFEKIDEISKRCQFTNCDHAKSVGCAVLAAVETGEITERQLENYQKLQHERLLEENKHDKKSARQHKQKQRRR